MSSLDDEQWTYASFLPARRTPQFLVVNLVLGLAWWSALLVPQDSRRALLSGVPREQLLLFAMLVGIGTSMSWLFRSSRRRWPKLTLGLAFGSFWLGSSLFLAPVLFDPRFEPGLIVLSPLFILGLLFPAGLPMAALSYFVLSCFDRFPRAGWPGFSLLPRRRP